MAQDRFQHLYKNTDDHLRNHGFLLTPNGWILSPAYDINPNEFGAELCLNINDSGNALHLNLAMEIANYWRLEQAEAKSIINKVLTTIGPRKYLQLNTKYQKQNSKEWSLLSAWRNKLIVHHCLFCSQLPCSPSKFFLSVISFNQ